MKIYLSTYQSWIVDRVKEEWINNNKDITTSKLKDADIVDYIPLVVEKISKKHLEKKKLYALYITLMVQKEQNEFIKRDKYVDYYHVISETTKTQIFPTDKNIQSIPFWVNDKIFFNIDDKKILEQNTIYLMMHI